jgi:hypothetical protein
MMCTFSVQYNESRVHDTVKKCAMANIKLFLVSSLVISHLHNQLCFILLSCSTCHILVHGILCRVPIYCNILYSELFLSTFRTPADLFLLHSAITLNCSDAIPAVLRTYSIPVVFRSPPADLFLK